MEALLYTADGIVQVASEEPVYHILAVVGDVDK